MHRPMKKMLAATVAASGLFFIAACGSDEAETAASAMSSVASSVESSAAESSSSAEAESTTAEAAPSAVQEEIASIAAEVQAGLPNLSLEPVQGEAASPEQAAAIEGLIRGVAKETSLRGYLTYIPNNTCSRVIEANGGMAALDVSQVPDVALAAYPQFQNAQVSIDSVSDIQVQGDTASAVVTATSGGESTTATQRFLNEGGSWKFCD